MTARVDLGRDTAWRADALRWLAASPVAGMEARAPGCPWEKGRQLPAFFVPGRPQ